MRWTRWMVAVAMVVGGAGCLTPQEVEGPPAAWADGAAPEAEDAAAGGAMEDAAPQEADGAEARIDAGASTGRCGDGRWDPGEGCDDGNTANGDGCAADCTVEVPEAAEAGSGCGTVDRAVNGGALGRPHPFCDDPPSRDTFVPDLIEPVAVRVRFHAIARGAQRSITQAQLDVLLAQTNQVLAPTGILVVQDGALDAIVDPDGGLIDLTGPAFDGLVATNNAERAVDAYIVNSFERLCGQAADIGHPGGGADGLVSVRGCGATTLAHELGHLFGLWHPHHPEGADCGASGDLLCDTPADPGPPSAAPEGAGTCVDNAGVPGCGCNPGAAACQPTCPGGEAPDPFNTMSYYGCADRVAVARFSPEQAARMLCYLQSQYGYALETDCQDADGDGHGFAGRPTCPARGADCDDAAADVSPSAVETCDGRDEDCDGQVDEGLVRGCGEAAGICQRGTQTCRAGNWGPCEGGVEPGPERCDGLDNDCDGVVDDLDDPTAAPVEDRCPMHGVCAGRAVNRCVAGAWTCDLPDDYVPTECAVTNAACGHGSLLDPTCLDGIDNDCDGVRDENSLYAQCVAHPDFDRVQRGLECWVSPHGRCAARGGTYACVELAEGCGVQVDCQGATFPEAERCDDQDWDCDGHVRDRGDIDGDGYGDCRGALDCDEGRRDVHPGAPEVCNGRDDDCDGRIDEGVQNACGRCGAPPPEVCNGRDDDCDGVVDEGVANRCGGCGAVPTEVCNGRDDDCDGQVDEGGPVDEAGGGTIVINMSTRQTVARDYYVGATRDVDLFRVEAQEARSGTFGCEGGCGFANERTNFRAELRVPATASGFYELCAGPGARPVGGPGERCVNVAAGRSATLDVAGLRAGCCNGIACNMDNSTTFFAQVRGVNACSSQPYRLSMTTSEQCVP